MISYYAVISIVLHATATTETYTLSLHDALPISDPGLDPDHLLAGWPRDVWGALVLQVMGQQLSRAAAASILARRSEEHTSELQSRGHLVCRLLLEKKT